MTNPIAHEQCTLMVVNLSVPYSSGRWAERKDAFVNRSSNPAQLDALVSVPLGSRPLVTGYEMTSTVAWINPRSVSTMFPPADAI